MKRVPALVLALLVSAACGDGGTETPNVDRIQVTPDETALASVGAQVQFEAQALDPAGAPLEGLSFDWSSSSPDVATVDATGRATSMGVGEAFIRATAAGVTGEARLVVRECGEALSLAPGEWTALDVPSGDECGFILPSGNNGDRYRVAVVRTTAEPTATDTAYISLRITGLGTTEAPVALAPEPAPRPRRRLDVDRALVEEWVRVSDATRRFHLELRDREAEMLARVGPEALLPDLSRAPGAAPLAVDAPDRILIDPATPTLCSPAGTPAPAFKVAENDLLAIYQDSAQSLGTNVITQAEAQMMLDYYETHGKPIIDDYFGGVSDIDGNGKILLVAHPAVNSGTAAFVWSGDLLDKDSCPASNEAELIFFSASLIGALSNGNFQALETVVHEAKHVSSLYKSVRRLATGSPYHPGWIEEGVAEIAGNMSARRAWSTIGGPAPHVMVDADLIVQSAGDDDGNLRKEFYGVAIRLNRTQGYLATQPNGVVTTPVGSASRCSSASNCSHSIYGSGWNFWRWLGDSYGNAGSAPYADADFFREQVDSLSPAGLAGVIALTGRSFSQLMVEYAAAVMLNGTAAPAPDRAFTSYDFPSAIELFCFAISPNEDPGQCTTTPGAPGEYPWPVTTLSSGTMYRAFADDVFEGAVGPGGMRIHEFRSNGTGTGAEISVTAKSNTRIVVARIN